MRLPKRVRRGPSLRHLATLGPWLALAACSGQRLTYPDLRTFPPQATFDSTLSERRDIGNALLEDRTAQVHAGQELDARVGLGAEPPATTPPAPVLEPAWEAPPVLPRPPSTSPEARFLRQQILAELDSEKIGPFLNRIQQTPADIEPATALASQEAEEERLRSTSFFGSYNPPVIASYKDWTTTTPLLDRVLRPLGVTMVTPAKGPTRLVPPVGPPTVPPVLGPGVPLTAPDPITPAPSIFGPATPAVVN